MTKLNNEATDTINQRLAEAKKSGSTAVDLSHTNLNNFPATSFEQLNKSLIDITLCLAYSKLIQDDLERTCLLLMLLFETKITTLDLSENSLYKLYRDPKFGIDGIRKITNNLRIMSVNTLILRNNYLFWPGLLNREVFLNAHKDSGIIQLGIDGIKALCDSLKCCPNIHTLDLSDNMCLVNIKDGAVIKGVHAFVLVPKCLAGTNIRTLNLSKNHIGRMNNNAVTQLIQGFEYSNINTVILQDNDLASLESYGDVSSVAAFSSGFKNSSVIKLDLCNNNLFTLSTAAVTAFAAGFGGTNVSVLDIRQNSTLGLKDEYVADWIRAFASGLKVTHIHTVSHDFQGLRLLDGSMKQALHELNNVLADNKATHSLSDNVATKLDM